MQKHTALPVEDFSLAKFSGKWFEIARLDHLAERDLGYVIADFTMNDEQSAEIVKEGRVMETGALKVVEGTLKRTGKDKQGALKASFLKSFYSPYLILDVDDNYEYALVAGNSVKNLWIFSRHREIPQEIRRKYLNLAESHGFDTSKLIWVKQ